MVKKIMTLISLILVLACSSDKDRLVIGLIRPSTDHLPVGIAIEMELLNPQDYLIRFFSSGWEVNEALINGNIDLAVMPFTYAWTGVSRGYQVRTISFFELESDGIIAHKNINSVAELDGRRLGVLRASTLEIFAEMLNDKYEIEMKLVYFRTPMEMAAALTGGSVDALSFYVPAIFKFSGDFHVISWYSDYFPLHTCCDIVAGVDAIEKKEEKIRAFLEAVTVSSEAVNNRERTVVEYMKKNYQLTKDEAEKTLEHTKFKLGLSDEDMSFQLKIASKMYELGYLDIIPGVDDVFERRFMVNGND